MCAAVHPSIHHAAGANWEKVSLAAPPQIALDWNRAAGALFIIGLKARTAAVTDREQ